MKFRRQGVKVLCPGVQSDSVRDAKLPGSIHVMNIRYFGKWEGHLHFEMEDVGVEMCGVEIVVWNVTAGNEERIGEAQSVSEVSALSSIILLFSITFTPGIYT